MPIVSVLWGLGLLTAISLSLLWIGTQSYRLAQNGLEMARVNATVDAGINRAVAALLDPQTDRRWRTDGGVQSFEFDGVPFKVSVQDELGKIDLNQAEPTLLARFGSQMGLCGRLNSRQAHTQLRSGMSRARCSSGCSCHWRAWP